VRGAGAERGEREEETQEDRGAGPGRGRQELEPWRSPRDAGASHHADTQSSPWMRTRGGA